MDFRFTDMRQRDTSVEMLRVKMSRRRSQTQKENRQHAVNKRRQLDKVPEIENSTLDASIIAANMSTIQEKTLKSAKGQAAAERMKQLERWKERKACQKEKETRERARKGVFKTGLFHPKDILTGPSASTRAKEAKLNTTVSQSIIVTRSMKPQHVQKPLKTQDPNTAAKKAPRAAERSTRSRVALTKPAAPPAVTKTNVCAAAPVGRAASTRSANRPLVAEVPAKNKTKEKSADVRTTRSRAVVNPVPPPSGRGRNCKASINVVHPVVTKESEVKELKKQEAEEQSEEDMVVDRVAADVVPAEDASSFAPDGFVFKAPAGLFKFEPLTPRSADAFLTPSFNFSFKVPQVPVFNMESQEEQSEPPPPPKSPCGSPPLPPSAAATPASPLESRHDVRYFRSQVASETDRLVSLSAQWESKVEDESIPEEMRDQMRSTIGQARLLMKERFNQFLGLVDDCELGRGQKVTTCSDLQGFWDMVYYQVEDVFKKFDALKAAEARGWLEEQQPAPRRRKVAKKPAAAPAKSTGSKAAARSRLAAVKAAMKAQQAATAATAEEATEAAGGDGSGLSPQRTQRQAQAPQADSVVFDGGFFRVESPAKPAGSVRKSNRLVAAMLPQLSPRCSLLSPRRLTGRLLTPPLTPASNPTPNHASQPVVCVTFDQTPGRAAMSQPSQSREDTADITFVEKTSSDGLRSDAASVSDLDTLTPAYMAPSICVVQEQDEQAEPVPLSQRLSVSPPPGDSSALSCSLSPQQPPSSTLFSSPGAQDSMCNTPDGSVSQENPVFDFERYFQPLQRHSPSPMATDVEMDTNEDQSIQEEAAPAAASASSLFTPHSPQAQAAESDVFLFTPNLSDRIRQSVCPTDLMVFTPPS